MNLQDLHRIQSDLRRIYGPNHYYTQRYSAEELSYSGKVPEWMLNYIPDLGKKGKVLDIGPGYGTLAAWAAKLTGGWVVSIDRVPLLSWEVCRELCIQRLLGDVEREGCPRYERGWQAVIMTEVLEHFNFHPVPTLANIRSKMDANGRLFLSTPDADSWGRCNNYKHMAEIPVYRQGTDSYDSPKWLDQHIWQYTEPELRAVLAYSGFKPLQWAKSRSVGGEHFNVEAVLDPTWPGLDGWEP